MMKAKRRPITLSNFGTMWVIVHAACIFLLAILFALLAFPVLIQYATDDPSEKLPLNVQLYLNAAPAIAVIATLFVLSLLQLFVSSRTIRILPSVWPAYSLLGIMSSVLLYSTSLTQSSAVLQGSVNGAHLNFYAPIALILIMMGLFQAFILVRWYSFWGALAWLLAHFLVAGVCLYINGRPDLQQALYSLPCIACATSPLCWYFYRSLQPQMNDVSHQL